MNTGIKLIAISALIVFASCSGGQTKEDKEKQVLTASIDSLEQAFFGNEMTIDKDLAAKLLQSYIQFTDTYPMDANTADYLYKGAGIARGVRLYNRAMEMYNRILTDYPDYPKTVETHFLVAFTYDNDIKDVEAARQAYNEVIEKYPNHEFAEQARERLKTIDLSDEELIELFMQRNAETAQQ